MEDIKDIREEINKIDKEMVSMFEKRMDLIKKVALYKKENIIPIFDKKREDELINKNLSYINIDEIKPYYVNFIKNVMSVSKKYQESIISGLRVVYSGVEGAYSYIAAKNMYETNNLISSNSFSEAYKSVENGTNDIAILPIENSYAGDVGEVMDLIFSGSLYVNRICDVYITHNLLVNSGVNFNDIDTITSHPQAISQCSDFINKYNFKIIEDVNTAMAAKRLKESGLKNVAVIASSETAKLYGLSILKEQINNSNINTTRFASFSRVMPDYYNIDSANKNFIIVFTVKNEAGALAKCLDIIGAHGFNMRNLRSRPMKSLMWRYFFFCEIEGDMGCESAKDMIRALNVYCDKLKIAGNYINE